MTEPKDTNPKDAMASDRAPLHLVPDTAMVEVSLAFAEGAMKYGAYNWRTAGVKNSVYYSAMRRHLAKWYNGEDRDPVTGVKHLASVIASASILLDAERCGKVDDDRPPAADVPTAEVEEGMAYLKGTLNKAKADSLNQGAEQLGVLGRDYVIFECARVTQEAEAKAKARRETKERYERELAAQNPYRHF